MYLTENGWPVCIFTYKWEGSRCFSSQLWWRSALQIAICQVIVIALTRALTTMGPALVCVPRGTSVQTVPRNARMDACLVQDTELISVLRATATPTGMTFRAVNAITGTPGMTAPIPSQAMLQAHTTQADIAIQSALVAAQDQPRVTATAVWLMLHLIDTRPVSVKAAGLEMTVRSTTIQMRQLLAVADLAAGLVMDHTLPTVCDV
jgi:hypothetical protein